jgi:DNA-binding CsgD family transcriptional regulator
MKRTSVPVSEIQLREYIAAGMTRKQIATKHGFDEGRLSTTMTVLGIAGYRSSAKKSVNAHDAVALLLQGLTMNQIGAAFKVGPQTVRLALIAAKLPTNLRAAVLWQAKQKAKPAVSLLASDQGAAIAQLQAA